MSATLVEFVPHHVIKCPFRLRTVITIQGHPGFLGIHYTVFMLFFKLGISYLYAEIWVYDEFWLYSIPMRFGNIGGTFRYCRIFFRVDWYITNLAGQPWYSIQKRFGANT